MIAVIGCDGSGKSTTSKELLAWKQGHLRPNWCTPGLAVALFIDAFSLRRFRRNDPRG